MANTQYASIQDVKAESDSTDAKWDTVIQQCLNAAAETIDGFCNRGVSFVTEATASLRQFAGSGKDFQRVLDFTTATLVEYRTSNSANAWQALTPDDWMAFSGDPQFPNFDDQPHNAVVLTGSRLSLFPTLKSGKTALPSVRITARWGYADEVPEQVRRACIAQASRWWKRGQSQWADALANGEVGILQFRKVLDPDIQMLLVNSRLVRPAL